jgi:hypothetical protein
MATLFKLVLVVALACVFAKGCAEYWKHPFPVPP